MCSSDASYRSLAINTTIVLISSGIQSLSGCEPTLASDSLRTLKDIQLLTLNALTVLLRTSESLEMVSIAQTSSSHSSKTSKHLSNFFWHRLWRCSSPLTISADWNARRRPQFKTDRLRARIQTILVVQLIPLSPQPPMILFIVLIAA